MKKLAFLLTLFMVLAFTVSVNAESIRNKNIYTDRQTFKKDVNIDGDMKFGDNASILTDSKNLYPRNQMHNSELAIWSGGTRWGSGALASVPDSWYVYSQSTLTGVTRIDVDTISPVSSVTPPFIHSMYINTWDTSTGPGVTKYVAYPSSGVSTSPSWYKKFAGRTVVFGAYVKRDLAQPISTGVTTGFIRPFINRHETYVGAETYFEFGDYVESDGWTLSTIEYDVPAGATAFEVGFAMNPTVLAGSKSGDTGDSAYVVAPFILINPLNKAYVPVPKEEIFFINTVNPFGAYVSGGSSFVAGDAATVMDLSSDDGWAGKIPDDVELIYATVSVGGTWPNSLYMYGDNVLGGVSFYSTASGASPQATTAWIPVSSTGTINIPNPSGSFSGTSMFVHGVKMR